jgi:hypothetical protein
MDPNFRILITKDIIMGYNFRGHDYEFYYSWIHRIIIPKSNEIMLLLVLYLYLE